MFKLFLIFVLPFGVSAQLLTNEIPNIQQYIEDHLLGDGTEVYNVHYEGHPNAIAAFSTGVDGNVLNEYNFFEGIFLSTGEAFSQKQQLFGPNNSPNLGTNFDLSGSPLIESIFVEDVNMFDQALLYFDLKTYGDTLSIDYIFGSEEYLEYISYAYQDIFGCFIKGPGYPEFVNIAKFFNSPISIHTFNNGYANAGPCINCLYYVFNGIGMSSPNNDFFDNHYYIAFDGFTKPLQIKLPVEPLGIYTIAFVVADANDAIFDSGVFIKNQSIKTNTINNKAVNNSFNLYPNPASDQIILESNDQIEQVTIFSIHGDFINQKRVDFQQQISVNVSDLALGVYWIEIKTNHGLGRQLFVKN